MRQTRFPVNSSSSVESSSYFLDQSSPSYLNNAQLLAETYDTLELQRELNFNTSNDDGSSFCSTEFSQPDYFYISHRKNQLKRQVHPQETHKHLLDDRRLQETPHQRHYKTQKHSSEAIIGQHYFHETPRNQARKSRQNPFKDRPKSKYFFDDKTIRIDESLSENSYSEITRNLHQNESYLDPSNEAHINQKNLSNKSYFPPQNLHINANDAAYLVPKNWNLPTQPSTSTSSGSGSNSMNRKRKFMASSPDECYYTDEEATKFMNITEKIYENIEDVRPYKEEFKKEICDEGPILYGKSKFCLCSIISRVGKKKGNWPSLLAEGRKKIIIPPLCF